MSFYNSDTNGMYLFQTDGLCPNTPVCSRRDFPAYRIDLSVYMCIYESAVVVDQLANKLQLLVDVSRVSRL